MVNPSCRYGEKNFFITQTGLNFENCIKLDKVKLESMFFNASERTYKKNTCIHLDMETRNSISRGGFVKTPGPKAQ